MAADGSIGLAGSDDGRLELWNLSTGSLLQSFRGHEGKVRSVALSADGQLALSGSDDKTLRLWAIHRQASGSGPAAPESVSTLLALFGGDSSFLAVALDAAARLAFAGDAAGHLCTFEIRRSTAAHSCTSANVPRMKTGPYDYR
jgi:WD40 repeat protein